MHVFPCYWQHGNVYDHTGKLLTTCTNEQEFIQAIASRHLFVLCDDVLNVHTMPFVEQLLGEKEVQPLLSKTRGILGFALKMKIGTGYAMNASSWAYPHGADEHIASIVHDVFHLTGFSSSTSASLSEKMLRATLPEKLSIHRPGIALRTVILENSPGGRVDRARIRRYFPRVYEYDKNKAYLFFSQWVPSPFLTPKYLVKPTLEEIFDYPAGYFHVLLVAHGDGIAPIQVLGDRPVEGEVLDMWLWSGELEDCISVGYHVVEIQEGYAWEAMSDFMQPWAAWLWELYQKAEDLDPFVRIILKRMMVGLPGRFLRAPVKYVLVPEELATKEDIDILLHSHEVGQRLVSRYAMHAVDDRESAALSAQGAYIVMCMRRELWRLMRYEEMKNNPVLRSYVDCLAFALPMHDQTIVGSGLGQYKLTEYRDVYLESNRFVGYKRDPHGWPEDDEAVCKAPGYTAEERIALWQRHHESMRTA